MTYNFWTDGACTLTKTNNEYKPGPGGWAWALVDVEKDKVLIFDHNHVDNTTNQRMELTAICVALIAAKSIDDLKQGDIINIHSDSAYCINIFTQWISGWKSNGWTRKGNKPIENLDLIQGIDKLLSELKTDFKEVNFIKVRGHSDDKYNNYVDKLAQDMKNKKPKNFIPIDDYSWIDEFILDEKKMSELIPPLV